ncbi:MAG TPA: hypothetical protein VFZ71_09950 [Pyrinomonadaceae bacterium]
MIKFIDFAHPEGGRFVFHVDHLTSAHYRPGDGDTKARLGLDLDERQNEIIVFGEEAERIWNKLQQVMGAS